MEVRTVISCDLTASRLTVVEVAHNDELSRLVECRLLADCEPWEVPEGATASVSYTLPDGTPGMYDAMPDGTPAASIEGSTVTVRLVGGIMAVCGASDVAVVLRKGAAQLATFPFRVNVIGSNPLTSAETYPALGNSFEGKLFFGGPGGVAQPLVLGPGLSIRPDADGVMTLYVSGGTDAPDIELPVTVTQTEDGTILVSADVDEGKDGTILISAPVNLASDGTIIIGGDNNG